MYLPSQSPYVTDDDEEENEAVGVVALDPLRPKKQGSPSHMALIKPRLPKGHKVQCTSSYKIPRGRPMTPAPRLAKHLEKFARPISLKLSH